MVYSSICITIHSDGCVRGEVAVVVVVVVVVVYDHPAVAVGGHERVCCRS
jgi:hypothetical protein